jgi:GxxExxY protein
MEPKSEKDPRTYAIIGAAMEVHRQLGCGFLEAVYQQAMALELASRGIPYRREVELPVFYKGVQLDCKYKADFICYEAVIAEMKALSQLGSIEEAQILNYLKVTGLETGLLLNFGRPSLEYRRFVRSKNTSANSTE